MKKTALGLALLTALGGMSLAAVRFEIGVLGGTRTVSDAEIKTVYGNGMVYYPYLALHAWKGLFAGAGYEGGYTRKGTIGIYGETSTLRVDGFEAFIGYEIKAGTVTPYLKAGYALFSYKQTIESPFIGDRAVNARTWTPTFGGGLKLSLSGSLFAAGEIRFVPLKVKPYEDEVDLGGVRYTAGFGLKF